MITLKMAARNFLPRCIVFKLRILNDCIEIRLKNAVHLGKKFLAAIFSVILYFHCGFIRTESVGKIKCTKIRLDFLASLTALSPVTGLSYIIAVLLQDLIVFFTGYKFIVRRWFI